MGGFFVEYQEEFRDWENLNIIERVPENGLSHKCHYLPHRSVIRLGKGTTKIRFWSVKWKPFLNEFLHKGINLIELISEVLDHFRNYPIGITSGIEKVYLMLSVMSKDRDFLDSISHAMKDKWFKDILELFLVSLPVLIS